MIAATLEAARARIGEFHARLRAAARRPTTRARRRARRAAARVTAALNAHALAISALYATRKVRQ